MQISFHKWTQTFFKLKVLRYLSIHAFNVTSFGLICYLDNVKSYDPIGRVTIATYLRIAKS